MSPSATKGDSPAMRRQHIRLRSQVPKYHTNNINRTFSNGTKYDERGRNDTILSTKEGHKDGISPAMMQSFDSEVNYSPQFVITGDHVKGKSKRYRHVPFALQRENIHKAMTGAQRPDLKKEDIINKMNEKKGIIKEYFVWKDMPKE